APEKGVIDVTADLPSHFRESLATLGFDCSAGDALSLEEKAGPSPEAKQRKVAAAAKARRRERRGERRARGSVQRRGRR
ncbi:MAG TPA: RNA pseudouridine synthase, partial [Sphingomicrobium sp.]|nr:RNA pseudouridine synthase [Sphingomicrobium sp.]